MTTAEASVILVNLDKFFSSNQTFIKSKKPYEWYLYLCPFIHNLIPQAIQTYDLCPCECGCGFTFDPDECIAPLYSFKGGLEQVYGVQIRVVSEWKGLTEGRMVLLPKNQNLNLFLRKHFAYLN